MEDRVLGQGAGKVGGAGVLTSLNGHVLGMHTWAPRRLPGWLARKRLCTML